MKFPKKSSLKRVWLLLVSSFLGFGPFSLYGEPQHLDALVSLKPSLYNEPNLPTTGPATGKTVIVEFFDYACPHCRSMYPPIHEVTRCDPNVLVVYRPLPLLGPESKMMAKAALAAHKQGKFEEMHTWLMTQGYEANRTQILQHLPDLGIRVPEFIRDWDGNELEKVLDHSIELALKLNIRNVPSIIVGDYISREALEQKDFIDLLNKVHQENGTPLTKIPA